MQQKMGKTRLHVDSRIRTLTDILAPVPADLRPERPPPPSVPPSEPQPPARPPSYEEATLPPPSYSQTCVSEQPNTSGVMRRSETSDSVSSSEQGEIMFSMPDVQVFHVSAEGEVTTPSYPETLHLIKLDRQVDKSGAHLPPAFIEVGQWTYPLLKGKSPIMKSSYGKTILY